MTFRRIYTIYRKELADVLRDRRTMVATIVIPVVLYPLLMLVSLQAASIQASKVAAEQIVVGFDKPADLNLFKKLVKENQHIQETRSTAPSSGTGTSVPVSDRPVSTSANQNSQTPTRPTSPTDTYKLVLVSDLSTAVHDQHIQVGVKFTTPTPPLSESANEGAGIPPSPPQTPNPKPQTPHSSLTHQLHVRLFYQPERLRSGSAATRLNHMFDRIAAARVKQRLTQLHVDPLTIQPVVLKQTILSTPGSLLSLILPLVLVLMTITCAVYPAIDLTAGEHERGTLETLMVCPVPTVDLVAGKFLTVTTIAILGATLNLVSIAATVYFGGLGKLLTGASRAVPGPGAAAHAASGGAGLGFPMIVIPIILVSLIPFSILMSAILIAVCGCARSFKEAQNYVTPVIIAVLLPAVVASIPGAQLEGLMLVLPVGNMVLLLRQLLSGAAVSAPAFIWVILSTCAYAAAAVALTAQTFGKESVVFADSVSLRSLLGRNAAKPSRLPPLSMAALYVAILFPVWFYLQSLIQTRTGENLAALLVHTAFWMPLFFIILPAAMLWYWRINIPTTLRLHRPQTRFVLAGILLGLVMWTLAQEVFVLQQSILPIPQAMLKAEQPLAKALATQPLWLMILVVALVPALCEETLFRGLLLSGLRSSLRKWTAIALSAAAFAAFHFFIFKFSTTFVLGAILAWLCWQSRSIWPGIIAHATHNAVVTLTGRYPHWQTWIGINPDQPFAHLPWPVLLAAAAVFVIAWQLGRRELTTDKHG